MTKAQLATLVLLVALALGAASTGRFVGSIQGQHKPPVERAVPVVGRSGLTRPPAREVQLRLARFYSDIEWFKESRQVLGRLLAVTPDDVDALKLLAAIEINDGRYARAAALLERAARLAPNDEAVRSAIERAGRLSEQFHAVRFEPTLPLVLILIVATAIFGQAVTRLGWREYFYVTVGVTGLVMSALAWLYVAPV